MNAVDLIETVVNVLVNVPRRVLKKNFVQHCSHLRSKKELQSVQQKWKVFAREYDEFKREFPLLAQDDEFMQRLVVQMATVSTLMGKIDVENDTFGLYAGCVLFVSEWSKYLGRTLFPESPVYAFYALWSSILNMFGVDWMYHGSTNTVLIALTENADIPVNENDDDGDTDNDADDNDEDAVNPDFEPYPCIFPGAAPDVDLESGQLQTRTWSSHFRTIDDEEVRRRINILFGYPASSKRIPSKHFHYFNPSDTSKALVQDIEQTWALDLLPYSADTEHFESDEGDDDEDEAARVKYKGESDKLKAMLLDRAVVPLANARAATDEQQTK